MENYHNRVSELAHHFSTSGLTEGYGQVPFVIDTDAVMQLKFLLIEFSEQKRIDNIRLTLQLEKQPQLATSQFNDKRNILALGRDKKAIRELEISARASTHFSTDQSAVTSSIVWQGNTIGRLDSFNDSSEELQLQHDNLSARVVRLLTRFYAQAKMQRWYQFTDTWVGNSRALAEVELSIAQYAPLKRHIAIIGDKGTGKKIAALRLVSDNVGSAKSFYHLKLADIPRSELAAELNKRLEQNYDVIYISDVNHLLAIDWPLLTRLAQQCNQDTRLIFGIRQESGRVSTLQEYLSNHCLTLTLPTLQQRQQDVGAIAQQYWSQSEQGKSTSEPCPKNLLQQLEKISWKNNVESLHLLLQTVFNNQANQPLAQLSLHELLVCHPDIAALAEPERHSAIELEADALPVGALYSSQFAEQLRPEEEHPAILKALTYLAENFKQSFSLKDLAEHAFVSPSHLSFLFKNRFGKSFKRILIDIRIDKAQQILRRQPLRQITQICGDVGFVDLSHFEKTFKKTTGITPRQYREQYRKKLPIEAQRRTHLAE